VNYVSVKPGSDKYILKHYKSKIGELGCKMMAVVIVAVS
jgi:hypothetical protein